MKRAAKILAAALALTVTLSVGWIPALAATPSDASAPVLRSSKTFRAASPTAAGYTAGFGSSTVRTADGGLFAALSQYDDDGNSGPDLLVRYKSDGGVLWEKPVDGTVYAVCETSGGRYLAEVGTDGTDDTDSVDTLRAYDAAGSLIFTKTLSESVAAFAPAQDGAVYALTDPQTVVRIAADGTLTEVPIQVGDYEALYSIQDDHGRLYTLSLDASTMACSVAVYTESGTLLAKKKISDFPSVPTSSASMYLELYPTPSGLYIACGVKAGPESLSVYLEKLDAGFHSIATTDLDLDAEGFDVNADGSYNVYKVDVGEDMAETLTVETYTWGTGASPASPDLGKAPAQTVRASDSTGNSAQITAGDLVFLNRDDNLAVELGDVVLTAPVSVLAARAGDASLRLIRSDTPQEVREKIAKRLASGENAAVYLTLSLTDPEGKAIHELGGRVKIMLRLGDAQAAALAKETDPKLYYYDPDTDSLTDMHAAFDFTAKTATFYTDHLSTYVAAGRSASSTDSSSKPSGSSGAGSSTSSTVSNPDTGRPADALPGVFALLSAALLGALLLLRTKKA